MVQKHQIIGTNNSAAGDKIFHSRNPATQTDNEFYFHRATQDEINLAAEKAATAFQVYRKKSGMEKALFLEAIADEIVKIGDPLITVAAAETALPIARLEGERGRTVNQLKMFAALLREGSWVDARIDTALPERQPLPRPDLRFMHIPLGPVVVFGASNFPLAFSVAGGDTASALAAGCPVIVKAHPAHPATSALVGTAIQAAAIHTKMPDGVFSLLFDDGIEVGQTLVRHPLIKAVGFTGSLRAGKSLYDIAVSRPEPIPVYAEMSSTNPVFILPGAARENAEKIAAGYTASVTLGVGQFCTNPGTLIFDRGNAVMENLLKVNFEKTSPATMLTVGIADAFNQGVRDQLAAPGVETLFGGMVAADKTINVANPVLMTATAAIFLGSDLLQQELFGPAGMVVTTAGKDEMIKLAQSLRGQLTATVHGTPGDLAEYSELIEILEQKAGRVIINAFPTGVEVSAAMVHGGPFPATSDSRVTSVGTAAIYRFVRPVCFQGMPDFLLPDELKNGNPLNISRLVNGEKANGAIAPED